VSVNAMECDVMKDVTPKALRCAIGASCPAIYEVTPEAMKCDVAMAYPSLYEQQDGHIIIGKVMKEIPEEVARRIGPDEFAAWVPRGLVKPGDAE
jgi:hypothetical protein